MMFPLIPREPSMHYKTIVLGLLEEHLEIHQQFQSTRTLLSRVDRYAKELKTSHEAWMERLSQAKPGSDQAQTSSEALEFALKELEDSLASLSPNQNEPLSLEGA